jgi:hypothetical protein
MAKYIDNTSMGGQQTGFQTTRWSEVFNADTTDDDRRRIAIDSLLRRYWKPVYCYLRCRGYDNEPAKDLTQGFFQEIVLNSSLIQRADRAKGRFRTFLLAALNCYLTDVYRKDRARKRFPKTPLMQLQDYYLPSLPEASPYMTPDQLFNYAWASQILDGVIHQVKEQCYRSGKGTHWEVFSAKILIPITRNTKSPPLEQICKNYSVESEEKASNMIVTVKRCFRRALEGQMRNFVQSDSEIEEELAALFTALAKDSAG